MQDILDILGPELTPLITNLLLTLVGILFTYLGVQAKKLMARVERNKQVQQIRESLENNKEIVRASVEYVEQIGTHLKAEEKFNLAKEKALEFANDRGFTMTETELDVLIEQMVFNFNKGYEADIVVDKELIMALDEESQHEESTEIDENGVIIYSDEE